MTGHIPPTAMHMRHRHHHQRQMRATMARRSQAITCAVSSTLVAVTAARSPYPPLAV